jgi:asparagine synthase (glutamine-hydrolysing)
MTTLCDSIVTVGSRELPVRGDPFSPPELLYWDGRVDNRHDLLTVLRVNAGRELTSPALVLALYAQWGVEGLGRVIGDWSLVIADARRQAIILASDFAGVRPLFYTRRGDQVFWSSRLEALVAATGRDAIDEEYVGAFLTLGGHPTRTPYAGVFPVPAGQTVSIRRTGATLEPLWTMPVRDVVRYADERRYDEQLRALLREGVAARLRTNAPVIAELSGGLDSSSVVCMAMQLIRRGEVSAPGLTTISYVHPGSLDVAFIKEVEAFCGVSGVHLSTELNPLVADGAVGHASPQVWVPLHRATANVARRLGASTFLTGRNGDLAMGNWLDDSLQVAASLRTGQIGRAMREALAWSKTLREPMARILWRAMRASIPFTGASEPLYALDALAGSRHEETSLRKTFMEWIAERDAHQVLSTDWMQAPPERRKHFLALTVMREMRLLQPLEPIRGLDYTHPFAHRPLIEFVMSLPPEVLCRPGEPRRLMRRALGDLWPARLHARRSKALFGAPWIEALRPLALALLNAPQWHVVSRGWVDRASLTSRLQKLTRGLECNEPQLRQIILLEYWLRNRNSTSDLSAGTPQAA